MNRRQPDHLVVQAPIALALCCGVADVVGSVNAHRLEDAGDRWVVIKAAPMKGKPDSRELPRLGQALGDRWGKLAREFAWRPMLGRLVGAVRVDASSVTLRTESASLWAFDHWVAPVEQAVLFNPADRGTMALADEDAVLAAVDRATNPRTWYDELTQELAERMTAGCDRGDG